MSTNVSMSALEWAFKTGNAPTIKELINGQYAKPNETNKQGQNGLHLAVKYAKNLSTDDFGEIVYLLNEYKVDTKHIDCYGSTPLQQAMIYLKDQPLIVGLIATGGVRPTN